MGILSLVFACTFWLSFLGIIFGAIGKGKARNCLAAYGAITGKAKAGNILSTIGLIFGIVLTALAVIALIAIIAAGEEIFNSGYSYYY